MAETDEFTIEEVTNAYDIERFDDLLDDKHYLGSGQPVGDYLRQVVSKNGEWVALFAWGSCCYAIKLRDDYIGWSPVHRAERQKLVVQNRRFLVLGSKGGQPNLASQTLGLATRKIPEMWLNKFNYAPVLLESFTDLESYAGTSYKACGWDSVGNSKGYGRHYADFYIEHKRPKKLWVKPLHPRFREILTADKLPEDQKEGGSSSAHGVLPMRLTQARSLMETLQKVRDPRAAQSQFRIGSILAIVAMAMLSGYCNIMDFARYGSRLKQKHRAILGLPYRKKTKCRRVPVYGVYWELLSRIDPDNFAEVLNQWLAANRDHLPRCMAIDGKMIREKAGIVCLVEHATGRPIALAPCSRKEGEGEKCELRVSQKMLDSIPSLDGTIVTSDALCCQKQTAHIVTNKGGDYFLQVKGNQPTLLETAKQKTETAPSFFLTRQQKNTDA